MSTSRPSRRKITRHKHLTYFRLEKALAEEGCPICRLTDAAVVSFYEAFLYEKVNDRGLRSQFNADDGVCNRHLYALLDRHDGLAIAVMYRPLLERIVEAVASRAEIPTNAGKCLFCGVEREAEERYLAELSTFLTDEDLRTSFEGSEGLCAPHYEQARRNHAELPDWFVDFHNAKYSMLLDGVKRYIDAMNWSLGDARPGLTPEEERVWMRVVALAGGYRGMPPHSKKA